MKKMLILLVMMLGLVGCGSEQGVDSTTIPTPTETVITTPTPTEAPVESEDEMKDYYVDPNTGEKVEITPTETPATDEVVNNLTTKTIFAEMTSVSEDRIGFKFDGSAIGLNQGESVKVTYEIPNYEPISDTVDDNYNPFCEETWAIYQWWAERPFSEETGSYEPYPVKITITYEENSRFPEDSVGTVKVINYELGEE